MADGLDMLRRVDKDELRAYVKQAARRASQSPMAIASKMLYDTIATTRQVREDTKVIQTADEIAMLAAHHLSDDTPGEVKKR